MNETEFKKYNRISEIVSKKIKEWEKDPVKRAMANRLIKKYFDETKGFPRDRIVDGTMHKLETLQQYLLRNMEEIEALKEVYDA